MGRRPAQNPKSVQLAFRVDQATAEALDEQIKAEERPGLPLSRSDMARMLIAEALAARAEKQKRGKK
jgi:hypothetical protein